MNENYLKLAEALIASGRKHENYNRVTELAREYKALISGENFDFLLKRFIKREDKEAFNQRKEITQPITAAVASSLIKPFRKVTRNDKAAQKVKFNDKAATDRVKEMILNFNSSNLSENSGLNGFLNNDFLNLSFIDPNAWIVCEWSAENQSRVLKPNSFVVYASDALDFKFNSKGLDYLLVKQKIEFFKIENGKPKTKKGDKFIFYCPGSTFTFTEFDPEYLTAEEKETIIVKEVNKKSFIFNEYNTNLDFIPALRAGYEPDLETDSKTFVNPFHTALSFFRKSIKTVSEFDLTMSLHAFPQKFQYVEDCPGENKTNKCNGGKTLTGETCSVCKGSGVLVHKSAQDGILLPLPKDNIEQLDLSKLVHYASPPIDLVRFQKEYIDSLKIDAHLAVFNSQMFISSELQTAKTATEIETNLDGVYTTLSAFAEKYSNTWRAFAKIFAYLANVTDFNNSEIIHIFPSDLKLKTKAVLLNELKTANESGAPSFLRGSIMDDLADLIFAGSEDEKNKYKVKKRFFPFNANSEAEIQLKLASNYVDDEQKILYSNFDAIFEDIEQTHKDFYLLSNYDKQWEIVREKIKEYSEKIKSSTPAIDFNNVLDE